MKYFCHIETSSYHLWQAELLIESFKFHNLVDDLVLAITPSDEPVLPNYHKNIQNHKNKIVVPNVAKGLNRLCGLVTALQQGLLSDNYVWMHPDMVLLHPVENIKGNIMFQEDHSHDEIMTAIGPIIKKLVQSQNKDGYFWVPLGNAIGFSIDAKFLEEVYEWAYQLVPYTNFINIEKAALQLAIINHSDLAAITNSELEQHLVDGDLHAHFIHYKHGLPPHFHKKYYTYKPPISFVPAIGDPFDAIYMNNCNQSTNYLCRLIVNYKF